VKVEQPLADESNENSCLIAYYEAGLSDSTNKKLKLTNRVVMQFLQEPFFNELRTKQQLGYVVMCRPMVNRDVHGA